MLILPGCYQKPCLYVLAEAPFEIYISDKTHDDLFSQQYLGSFPRDSVKLYFINSQHLKSYDSVDMLPANYNHSVYVIRSQSAFNQSTSQGIHTFYFRRGYNIVDTIIFDESVSGPCDDYKLNSFKYNGVNLKGPFDSVVVAH
jgi:hypothetical protein